MLPAPIAEGTQIRDENGLWRAGTTLIHRPTIDWEIILIPKSTPQNPAINQGLSAHSPGALWSPILTRDEIGIAFRS